MSGVLAYLSGFPQPAAAADTAFITGQTLRTLRNDFTGVLGMRVDVGGASITVTQLGRWVVSGNALTHIVYIVNTSNTVVGTVTLNTVGAPAGAYLYGTLVSPVTLSASTTYYVLSAELVAGDQFYSFDTTVTPTAAGTVPSSVYIAGTDPTGLVQVAAGSNTAFIPVNFKYH